MKYLNTLYICLFLLFSSAKAQEFQENNHLLVIQKIASDKRSFIIRKGMKEQVYPGQKSLFTSKYISLIARAVKVERDFSMWQLEDSDATMPFQAGEIVTISFSPERIWSEIPKLLTDKKYQRILAKEEKVLLQKYGRIHLGRFQMLGSKTSSFKESTTQSENNDGTRAGYSFKFKYSKPINDSFRYELGLRYDTETLTLESPQLEEATQRYIATVGLQARFADIWTLESIPYLNIALGYGKSQSKLNDVVRTGPVTLVPSVSIGLDIEMSDRTSLLLEAGVESVNAQEVFADGIEQSTTITAGYLSLGIEFL